MERCTVFSFGDYSDLLVRYQEIGWEDYSHDIIRC